MINKVKTTYKKTLLLENQVETLKTVSTKPTNSSNFITFSKNQINVTIKVTKKILLASIDVKAGSSLYFQNQIDLNLDKDQQVRFTLVANGVFIYRSLKNLTAGYNNITIMKSYTPLIDETLDIYLKIEPGYGNQIVVTSETLTVWGIDQTKQVNSYQAIETTDNYVLAYLASGSLYYLLAPKVADGYLSDDFTLWGNAKSFAFVYDKANSELYLFYVDINSNLFKLNFSSKDTEFIASDVTRVSGASSSDNILVSYIKNKNIYYFEIDSQNSMSKHTKLQRISAKFQDCYVHFNPYSNLFIIVATDTNGSNYMFESALNDWQSNAEISAKISYNISTYGVNNEI